VQKAPVRFYRSSSGDEPARNWLQNLPKTCKKILGEDIATVQYGWPVGMPLVRKLEPNLWELRSRLPDGIARTFFTMHRNEIVLLHGFVKKSAKTPEDELDVARKRMKEVRNA
jgi:phage-related protein